ncbi:hypothetical protein FLACOL_00419 [Flavobacterium columnare]|uniref:DUF2851 family protein n=3 Tax=Flavobacterium TaxID=237 RepID=A0A246GKM6_9FLAO|nr:MULTISPECIES: DUF2851 family protein [Flavobacterium]OWP84857.1 hypothetical protein BWK59_03005 [Flavobacterium davisii]SPE76439.1 hypothetical protein FLACOL_00419 [Flavobacterium columnare]
MKEEFLYYVWKNKKIPLQSLTTVQGENLQILHSGFQLNRSGPDFFNVQLVIDGQRWAGNVEIHLKSSDWYHHHHQLNSQYDNCILHVVWEHDVPVFRKNNAEIPVLALQNYVTEELIAQYKNLKVRKKWINCEEKLKDIPEFTKSNWIQRLYFERLEFKNNPIQILLKKTNYDWENVFFIILAKNFGLNINGEAFFNLADSIPFTVLRKESFDVSYLEALFFGQAGLLPLKPQENYVKDLIELYEYIKIKYNLTSTHVEHFEFFRLRPDNFPTIRIAQLAMLYHIQKNLFTRIIQATSVEEFYEIFSVGVSDYWEYHYNFEKTSTHKEKKLSQSFIELLIINAILPIRFSYTQYYNKYDNDLDLMLIEMIKPEKNKIINYFEYYGMKAKNAMESQGLIQLKNKYCDANRCLECSIGLDFLKSEK